MMQYRYSAKKRYTKRSDRNFPLETYPVDSITIYYLLGTIKIYKQKQYTNKNKNMRLVQQGMLCTVS